ncbi:MAG: CHAT domain-containing protein, partial [Anaerolineae bacterium]
MSIVSHASGKSARFDSEQVLPPLGAYLQSETWVQARQVVEASPELLRDETQHTLNKLINAAHRSGDWRAVRILREHRNILRQCRRIGVLRAFAPHQGIGPDDAARRLGRLLRELGQPPAACPPAERVCLCHKALALVSPATAPQLWAALKVELGNALALSETDEDGETLERALQAYADALTVITRERAPYDWALVQSNRANALRLRRRGDQSANMREAIAAYEQVMDVLTRQSAPRLWAQVQNNLGNALLSRGRGRCPIDVERAIEAYTAALSILTRERTPLAWARVAANLASAYLDRLRPAQADNIEEAIAILEQVLEMRRHLSTPIQWATTSSQLAGAYLQRRRGNRAANVERAIRAAQQALQVLSPSTTPLAWTQAMHVLGCAYAAWPLGDTEQNLEKAIETLQQALTVLTRHRAPEEWAQIVSSLGSAYAARQRGDPAQNAHLAEQYWRSALEVLTLQRRPLQWAQLTSNLAATLCIGEGEDKPQAIEQALSMYHQALAAVSQETAPETWARIQHSIGAAYHIRPWGCHSENLARAIEHYRQSLLVSSKEGLVQQQAYTLRSIGNALRAYTRGSLAGNRERAIQAYQQALELPAFVEPVAHAKVRCSLAEAILCAGRSAEAIKMLSEALEALSPDRYSTEVVNALCTLSEAHLHEAAPPYASHLSAIDLSEPAAHHAFSQAVAALERALALLPAGKTSWRRAEVVFRLALAYSLQAQSGAVESWEKAVQSCEEILALPWLAAASGFQARVAAHLAHLHLLRRHWAEALAACRRALMGYEDAYRVVLGWSANTRPEGCHGLAAYAAARFGNSRAAIVALEWHQRRLLRDLLGLDRADLERAGAGDEESYRLFRQASAEICHLEERVRSSAAAPWSRAAAHRVSLRARAAHRDLQAALQRLRSQPGLQELALSADWPALCAPHAAPVALGEDRLAAAPIAYLAATPVGSVTLLLLTSQEGQNSIETLWSDGLTEGDLHSLTARRERPVTGECLSGRRMALETALADALPVLGERLLAPLAARLRALGAGEVVLIPTGPLQLVPLHAARYRHEGCDVAFLDEFVVRYAPSLDALRRAKRSLEGRLRRPASLCALAVPAGKACATLALAEVRQVSSCFAPERRTLLLENRATPLAASTEIARATCVHVCCPARTDLAAPQLSYLELAHKQVLTWRAMAAGHVWQQARLAVLPQAEVISSPGCLPQEIVSLPSSLLSLGVPGVISTLWPVADISRVLLIGAFYD